LEIERLHQLEKSYVLLLNAFDGWDLEWCGGGYDHYDAKGKTPKGAECVIEFKFRNKYYQTKMLEVFKYEKLMADARRSGEDLQRPRCEGFLYVLVKQPNRSRAG
jgi:hypothetical protein